MQSFLTQRPLVKKVLLGAVLVLVLVGVYVLATKTQTNVNKEEAAREEALEVKQYLSKHLILPDGEEPDIRKISQKIDDPFFARAEIGDYLIIFYKSRIAYIYSPSKDIISNAGVVFINPQQDTSKKDGLNSSTGTTGVTGN